MATRWLGGLRSSKALQGSKFWATNVHRWMHAIGRFDRGTDPDPSSGRDRTSRYETVLQQAEVCIHFFVLDRALDELGTSGPG